VSRAARRTVTAYGRILAVHLRYDDVTYPYRMIELETSIRYGTGSDTAENGCTGRTNTVTSRKCTRGLKETEQSIGIASQQKCMSILLCMTDLDRAPTLIVNTTCTREPQLLLQEHQRANGLWLETCTSQRDCITPTREYSLDCNSRT
jgi:hypothetical protein